MRARELRRQPIVVGDDVDLVGDISGTKDTLARIVRIGGRRSILRRSADDSDPAERVLVANADALLIVVAAADPPPRTGFIDRCLVAAYTGGLDPILLVTKTDLADPTNLLEAYREIDVPILLSGRAEHRESPDSTVPNREVPARDVPGSDPTPDDPARGTADDAAQGDAPPADGTPDDARPSDAALRMVGDALRGRVTALVGHSGVGKSTLVNALVPEASRAIGTVTGVGKGRHTSSSAIALPLPGGGWIVDTPGVRSFGLAHVTVDDVLESFDDLLPATADCRPGCTHETPDIGCALDDLVANGGASRERLSSFRRLLASRSAGGDDSSTVRQ